ncbi:LysR family transcriptional regulator [Rhodobacter capsulatus]|uniref:LysR family transcriptional regulator n=1 Tax=Rhodobacter capsulatus TaxID=1061 RepID=A0A4U1JSD6_RHOCA|nr:LysR family transcriptional regulator [Rhodobacter capsulatus]TKD21934.1 LysR family transcriptional regulator [Rhodobacter capsulatus]
MADIRTFDLNLLRALEALLETRSVSRAAQRLGLSQPAVSGMLTRLRERLDDPLFVRTQRGMLPTPRAEELAPTLKAVLAEIEAILQGVSFDPQRADLTLRVAATDYAQRAVLLPFLQRLRQEAPGVRLSVRPVAADFPRQMAEGALDMALVTPEMAPETLRTRRLFEETYVVILRADHPQRQAVADLAAFCALDHAIMSHDGTAFSGATDRALDAIGQRRRVVASVPSFTILIDLIRRSDMLALVPRRLIEGEAGIIAVPPPVPVEGFRKILVWHERLQQDPAQRWLRDRLAASVGA